jgi:hypothetical protein
MSKPPKIGHHQILCISEKKLDTLAFELVIAQLWDDRAVTLALEQKVSIS